MENKNTKVPEILKGEALKVVEDLKFEDFEEFKYNKTKFLLILISAEDFSNSSNKEEVFISASTSTRGYDIYMLETIPKEDKKRIIFHEIIEADLRKQGLGESSHDLAKKTEIEVFGERG